MADTIIDLIRHGEPVGGRAYRGNGVDDPLSDNGWQQMWSAVADVSPWDQVISSPMIRCREFAEALSEKYSLPVSIESNIKEIGFGSWEGKTPDELMAENLQEYELFYQDPVNNRPEGAEELPDFIARVRQVFTSIAEDYKGKHVLVVAHAGVIRAMLTAIMEAPMASMYRIRSDYAGITRIQYVETHYRILFHNIVRTSENQLLPSF